MDEKEMEKDYDEILINLLCESEQIHTDTDLAKNDI